MIAEAIRNLLASSAAIRAQVAVYRFGAAEGTTTAGPDDGADAAIFTFSPAPSDAEGMLITVVERGGKPWGCRARSGAECAVQVEVWSDKAGRSDAALRRLARDVFELLNRADLNSPPALGGLEEWGCAAEPPRSVRDAEGYPGYRIEVRVRVLESA